MSPVAALNHRLSGLSGDKIAESPDESKGKQAIQTLADQLAQIHQQIAVFKNNFC